MFFITILKEIISGHNSSWTRDNTININNLNTNNTLIPPSVIKKRNNKFGNSVENKYEPNGKYIFVTIYGIIIIAMLFNLMIYVGKGGDEGKIVTMLQILITLCCFMVFFIWTCVVNLPLWIMLLIILLGLIIYLLVSVGKNVRKIK